MRTSLVDLNRINRFLTLLSRVNRTIVRADSPDRLYLEVCNIAVESGLFQFAWIGLLDPAIQQFRPMAQNGAVAGEPLANGALNATAHLILDQKSEVICNDLGDSQLGNGMHQQMHALGYQSMAGLPLCEMERVIGVFLLYCKDKDAFDPDISNLLMEVADDISFSLGHMRAEQQRIAGKSKLYYLAFYDAQTGLPNRALLDDRLPKLAALADQKGHLLMMLDIRLQRVEQIVQVLGKFAMDDVLRTIASRLETCRGASGLVVQLAHDEFAIVSPELAESALFDGFVQRVRAALSPPVKSDTREVFLQVGIGVAVYPVHEADVTNLLRRARAASERCTADETYRLYSADLAACRAFPLPEVG